MGSKPTILQVSNHLTWLFSFSTTESIGNARGTETVKYRNANGIREVFIRESM